MRKRTLLSILIPIAVPACSAAVDVSPERVAAVDQPLSAGERLPTGARITPTAAPGSTFDPLIPGLAEAPDFRAGHAVSLALSPDGRTLLALTSGYNLLAKSDGSPDPAGSNEYVFVYDVSGGAAVKTQVVTVPNTFAGIAWSPAGDAFYVSGGINDSLHVYQLVAGAWTNTSTIALGHTTGNGLLIKPEAAGVGVTADGSRAVVANFENDSVTIVDLAAGTVAKELDLRPGKVDPAQSGVAGGEYPFWVVVKGNDKAYVTSERDGEVVIVSLGDAPKVSGRIKVGGQPNKAILDRAQGRLFVANANSDTVSIIDTSSDAVTETIRVEAPRHVLSNPSGLKGSNPNDLALSPDESTLYVTLGGFNAVAVVKLGEADDDDDKSRVVGLIPTGWYPSAVRVSQDGSRLYAVNGKSNAGPNPGNCRDTLSIAPGSEAACTARNNYIWQLMKAGFLTVPLPWGRELARLTRQVASNNNFDEAGSRDAADELMVHLHDRVHHVIYVIKENRTYDQILGDLGQGDSDPSLNLYPEAVTPNHHALARGFLTLDRFEDSGETSGNGWNWTTGARATDLIEKTQPVNYAGRGLTYDWEGTNRNINVGYATAAERIAAMPFTPPDPDLFPGTHDVSAPLAADVDGEGATSYLWDAALRAGLTIRNYGCFGDLARYFLPSSNPAFIPPDRTPFADGLTVFYSTKAALQAVSDPYFRGFDMKLADYWRFQEWSREFDAYAASGELPALSFVRFPHDHTGSFAAALDGVNTPELQTADNDYAVGLLVDKVSKSPFADDTLVFVLEDDAQDGGDHVDAHRSLLLVAGAYVRQGGVVSTSYDTVNVLRTIEGVLGLEPLGLTDALAEPMADLFERRPQSWTYNSIVPDVLRGTALPLPPMAKPLRAIPKPTHDAAWWEQQTKGQDFSVEDRLDTQRFNEALWRGLKEQR